jgi:hypothetical protein
MSMPEITIDRPVFICGCHRTGTTLLQKSLSRHPGLDILPETKLLAWLFSPAGRAIRHPGNNLVEFVADRIGKINREWAKPDHAWRLEQLRASADSAPTKFASDRKVLRYVLAHATRREARVRVGEKTPLHIFHVPALLKEFPDARIIITRRDLRASYHSQSTRNSTKSLSYRPFGSVRFVASWLFAEHLAHRFVSRYKDSVRIVEYERLVSEPDEMFKELCDFVGIDYDDRLLDASVENSSFAGQSKGFTRDSIERWRDELPTETIQELEQFAPKAIVRAGYQLSLPVTGGSIRTKMTRLGIGAMCRVTATAPRLVCYLWRDPRYARFGTYDPNRNVPIAPKRCPRVIVLGNHKSGTTAIGKLLGELGGLSTTIDLPRSRRREGYRLAMGRLSINRVYARNANLFEADLVKIPALTFAEPDIAEFFSESAFVFVIRDPRDNIRSILNRRGISGQASRLSYSNRLKQTIKGSPSLSASAWGGSSSGYVGALAQRWCRAVELYEQIKDRATLVRYEDFLADKPGVLNLLATDLGIKSTNDISSRLDHQFQPAGDNSASLAEFFGKANLSEIERICSPTMQRYGYEPALNAAKD